MATPETFENGSRRETDGTEFVYYDGYWIRWYEPPEETLAARKDLIVQLTRRAFHHTEAGINTPGEKLEQAREAYSRQTDPALKRVNAAMLAGALFNRATDIFTTVVHLGEKGVEISPSNGLLQECGACFQEALRLGREVLHYSGHEGIDELWGEPLKAFTMPIAAFYESRYIKIAQTMADIDRVAATLCNLLGSEERYRGFEALVLTFAEAAKREAETMKRDPAIFDVWPRFVAAKSLVMEFAPTELANPSLTDRIRDIEANQLVTDGVDIITYVARARVPMPRSTDAFLSRCDKFRDSSPPRPRLASALGGAD